MPGKDSNFGGEDCRFPSFARTARGDARPTCCFFSGVVEFAHEKISLLEGTVRDFPGCVSYDRVTGTVLIFDFELSHEGGSFAIGVTADMFGADAGQEAESDVTIIPAVSDPGVKGVGAGFQKRRDVVGVVASALMIIGPTRCEVGVADAFAVEMQFVDAESGCVNGSAADRFCGGELFAILVSGRQCQRARVF